MSKSITVAAGIDTSKDKLDVAIHGCAEQLQVGNDAAGHRSLLAWLRRKRVTRVGIEASGGYERAVVAELRRAGFVVIVFQPIQVRAYAMFRLQRAKNDKIDAALIAACTAAGEDKIRPAPDARFAAFAEHLTLIEQIEEDAARYKTRRDTFLDKTNLQLIESEIVRLQAWRRRELKRLRQAIYAHADLKQRFRLIHSVVGIGGRTALALLVRLPEIGLLTRGQAAALVGLAPYDDDSGRMTGQRHIAGGRKRLRKSLYAAAMPAAFHWNPALIALYGRLTADGKTHKQALVACARKLVIYANTVVARGTPWSNRTAIA